LEEFSSLPSAKLTVDEFREIWFQNAADPPSFAAKPRTELNTALNDTEDSDEEAEEMLAIEAAETTGAAQIDVSESQAEAIEELANKEAEAEFLEDLVQDKELKDKIQQHLDKDQFQQALAKMAGTAINQLLLTTELNQQQTNAPADEGSLCDLDDDDEVSGAIIDDTSEHFILRAQLWMESNREYLQEQRGNIPMFVHCHSYLIPSPYCFSRLSIIQAASSHFGPVTK
jgi:transcription factor IIIB 90 kDa subunit